MTNNTVESDVKVPAALNLPFGQLFFGFHVTAYTPPNSSAPTASPKSTSFGGTGRVLSGRGNPTQSGKGKEKEKVPSNNEEPSTSWGVGRTLGASHRPTSLRSDRPIAEEDDVRVSKPSSRTRNGVTKQKKQTLSPDWDLDDDIVMIDSE